MVLHFTCFQILYKIRKFCMKFGQLILRKIVNIVATRCQILRLKCTKFNFDQTRWRSLDYSIPPSGLNVGFKEVYIYIGYILLREKKGWGLGNGRVEGNWERRESGRKTRGPPKGLFTPLCPKS